MFVHSAGANAIVIISPSTNYTTFENNTSTFTFNCSGDGTNLYWSVDEQPAESSSYVLNKGIHRTLPVSPDGLTVSSQLIVPTTKANNNTVVVCTVLDVSFNHQSSHPVRLILQGTICIMSYFHCLKFSPTRHLHVHHIHVHVHVCSICSILLQVDVCLFLELR